MEIGQNIIIRNFSEVYNTTPEILEARKKQIEIHLLDKVLEQVTDFINSREYEYVTDDSNYIYKHLILSDPYLTLPKTDISSFIMRSGDENIDCKMVCVSMDLVVLNLGEKE